MAIDDSIWARNPRQPLPKPSLIPPQPAGTMYAAGTHVGSDLGGHYVCVKATTSQPPAVPYQSNCDWHWSTTAAVADVAQTPIAHP
jgi:hypothetical protein